MQLQNKNREITEWGRCGPCPRQIEIARFSCQRDDKTFRLGPAADCATLFVQRGFFLFGVFLAEFSPRREVPRKANEM